MWVTLTGEVLAILARHDVLPDVRVFGAADRALVLLAQLVEAPRVAHGPPRRFEAQTHSQRVRAHRVR